MDFAILNNSLIPAAMVVVPIVALLMPVLIVFIVLHFRQRRSERLYQMVRYLADKGQPIPTELLDPPSQQKRGNSRLFDAFSLVGVGVGLGLMFYMLNLRFLIGVGGLLICIGIAQVLALAVEGRMHRGSPADAGPQA